jgi:hypothetical protein
VALAGPSYFGVYAHDRGYCPIPSAARRGLACPAQHARRDWLALRTEVAARLAAASRPVKQRAPRFAWARAKTGTPRPSRSARRASFDGNRRQSHLDWIQMIAELTNRPMGANSVLGMRPSGRKVDEYPYDIDLEVAEAAAVNGGGAGEMTVLQVAPTTWANPIRLTVWFGSAGASVKISTYRLRGQAASPLPWTPGDFVGRIEWIKGGVGAHVPGARWS